MKIVFTFTHTDKYHKFKQFDCYMGQNPITMNLSHTHYSLSVFVVINTVVTMILCYYNTHMPLSSVFKLLHLIV